jgi:flagellar biosynthesis protein
MSDRPRNPLAVALHYNGNGAPRVVAKGGGDIAKRIVEVAREHDVPLEEDAALAATLSRVELGREIPRELFVAVAHVLAFAWAVTGKRNLTVRDGESEN